MIHLAILPNMNKIKIENRSKVFKALGHPSRLLIVEELSRGERCVCQLVELVDADFSTVSKHLTVLKKAGIIEDRKDGKMVIYRLKVPCILRFIDCIDAVCNVD